MFPPSRRPSRSESGFSLTELLVVVVILGIISAITIPNFQRFSAKSKQAEAKTHLSALFTAQRTFHTEFGTYFADFRNVGYQPVGSIRYRHGFGAAGVNCPASYHGSGVTAGAAATDYNTGIAAVCLGNCSEILTPVHPGVIGSGNVTAASSFLAEARGDLDGDTSVDVWTINELKTLTRVSDDILS